LKTQGVDESIEKIDDIIAGKDVGPIVDAVSGEVVRVLSIGRSFVHVSKQHICRCPKRRDRQRKNACEKRQPRRDKRHKRIQRRQNEVF
jgi:hypothetical protein